MDSHHIVTLKRAFVDKYGLRVPSSVLDGFLESNAPECFHARKIVRSGNADWEALKKYSTFCRYDENPKDYESRIVKFDPAIKFPAYDSAQFVGDGFGDGSLNSYRMIQVQKKRFFEKIYLRESPDYRNVVWFYTNLQKTLADEGLRTPAVERIEEGDCLSIVYSEYIEDNRPLSKEKALIYYKKQFNKFYGVRQLSDEKHLFSVTDHILYHDGRRAAKEYISRTFDGENELLAAMEKSVICGGKMFCHGDWYHKNINRNGLVFDWDRCGFYPAGFDLAYCYSKSLNVESLSDLYYAISKYAPSLLKADHLSATLFFCFIFYSRRVGKQVSDYFLGELFLELKQILGVR